MMDSASLAIHFSPLIPAFWLMALGVIGAIIVAVKCLLFKRLYIWRILTLALFVLILAGPSLYEEDRESVPSVGVLIVDDSASSDFGERRARIEAARKHIENSVARLGEQVLDLRIITAPDNGALASKTALYNALETAFSDVPLSRRAGAVFLSDGQIHDVPNIEQFENVFGPVHILLSGKHSERDRRIEIIHAPSFGIVGQEIDVRFKIHDHGYERSDQPRFADVVLRLGDGSEIRESVRVGQEHALSLPVEHAGQNVFELQVAQLKDELTYRNNIAAIDFRGVRDRLRVLLVSGKPYAGGRTWRDLLKADPSVDLVHFTILREPDKIDATPQREMSLIAFPFRELFEIKLYEFDLIIFDRYRVNRILPDQYFQNIARYVEDGGAFFEVSGPAYAGENSIYYTALDRILPAQPSGQVLNTQYTPKISERGAAHPVTRQFDDKAWGPWMRQIDLRDVRGDILMEGLDNRPLLALNRVGEGRVAQLASDHAWLWARGVGDGDIKGGPHTELLRRIVHWLMKEPELDENAFDITVDGRRIFIQRAAFDRAQDNITITDPNGVVHTLSLSANSKNSLLEGVYNADDIGVYRIKSADGQNAVAVIGEINPPEFRDVLSTPEKLTPITAASNGGAVWLSDIAKPDIRFKRASPFAGRSWIAFEDKNAYTVTGAKERALLPLWASLVLLLGYIVTTWFFEGRRR